MGLKLITRLKLGPSQLIEHSTIRIIRNNSLKAIGKDIPKVSDSFLTKVILYGDSEYSDIQNHCKWSLLKLQISHRRLQTSHRRLQTSHRLLQTSHRRVTDDYGRVTDDYRRVTDESQTTTDESQTTTEESFLKFFEYIHKT